MSISVFLYTFDKKENSTAQPPTTGEELLFDLKSESSIIAPTLLLINTPTVNIARYNYCYIPDFGQRYYYITDIRWQFGNWMIICDCDVMATYKADIGRVTCYITRAAAEYDINIADSFYPPLTDLEIYNDTIADLWSTSLVSGYYCMGIEGSGDTDYYLIGTGQYAAFMRGILSDQYVDALVPGWQEIAPDAKLYANPLQYIKSVIKLPFRPNSVDTQYETVYVGYVPIIVPCTRVSNPMETLTFDTTLRMHPQMVERGNYLGLSPWSSYRLYCPPFGTFELDGAIMTNTNRLEGNIYCDVRTGSATLVIVADGYVISRSQAQLGVSVQTGQITSSNYSTLQIASASLDVVGSGLNITGSTSPSGGAAGIFGGVQSLISSISDIALKHIPTLTSVGNNGALDSLFDAGTRMIYEFVRITDEDLPRVGRPLCAVRRINNLSGFVLPTNFNVVIDGTAPERTEINTICNGGFFYD